MVWVCSVLSFLQYFIKISVSIPFSCLTFNNQMQSIESIISFAIITLIIVTIQVSMHNKQSVVVVARLIPPRLRLIRTKFPYSLSVFLCLQNLQSLKQSVRISSTIASIFQCHLSILLLPFSPLFQIPDSNLYTINNPC